MAPSDVLLMINQNRQNIPKPDKLSETLMAPSDDEDLVEVLNESLVQHDDTESSVTDDNVSSSSDGMEVLTMNEFNKVSPKIFVPINDKGKEDQAKIDVLKEQVKKEKESKKLQKEQEKKKRADLKLRAKKESELKRELLKKEKEEKERRRIEEKEEKERKRIEEKEEKERKRLEEKAEKEKKKLEEKAEKEKKRLEEKLEREKKKIEEQMKKEEEKLKQEDMKKKEEELKLKQKKKLQISNFFKPKPCKSNEVEIIEDNLKKSDFEKTFHDFYIKNGTILYNFKTEYSKNKASMDDFENLIGLNNSKPEFISQDSINWLKLNEIKKPKIEKLSAKHVYENSLDNSIMPMIFIKFYENFNYYSGTYTKVVNKEIFKNPCLVETPIFIDFDDEGDENEEGEGEDIEDLDDDEEDAEEDEDEDIDDFLERDLSPTSNTKITGPLIPKISWKSSNEDSYVIQILTENIKFPIDPKRNYWESELSPNKTTVTTNDNSTPVKNKKPKTLITDKKDLGIFAQTVNDQDYTIPTMVEILKKQLPSYTKGTIENTLKNFAKRVGPKPTEKKWEVNYELLSQS